MLLRVALLNSSFSSTKLSGAFSSPFLILDRYSLIHLYVYFLIFLSLRTSLFPSCLSPLLFSLSFLPLHILPLHILFEANFLTHNLYLFPLYFLFSFPSFFFYSFSPLLSFFAISQVSLFPTLRSRSPIFPLPFSLLALFCIVFFHIPLFYMGNSLFSLFFNFLFPWHGEERWNVK